jgi:CubicO group peptidase (beta-lactamase class C family)
VLKEDIDKGRLPGAVVAIARKGKLVYYEAFGFLDKPAGVPMPKDGIFRIASMTKPLATVGALMLYEENKLLVNDPVGKYLPPLARMTVAVMDPSGKTVARTEPARRQPTLQDLMRHTSGFSYGNRGESDLHRRPAGVGRYRRHHDRAPVHRGAEGAASPLSARERRGSTAWASTSSASSLRGPQSGRSGRSSANVSSGRWG